MRFSAVFTFILSLAVISSSFNVAGAMRADELLEEHLPQESSASRRKHTVKTGCSCMGCCSSGCRRDQRYEVDPDDDLYSSHVFITAYFPSSGWRRGTATIISDNCLVTAAHCLYYKGEYATEVMLGFGMREVVKCGCFFKCKDIKSNVTAIVTKPVFAIHPDFLRNPDSSYDISLMTFNKPVQDDFVAAGVDFTAYASLCDQYEDVQILSSDGNFAYGDTGSFEIGAKFGIAGIGAYSSDELIGLPITIAGYPAHVGRTCAPSYNMYCGLGEVLQIMEGLILHKTDTSDGNSGGAVRLRLTGEMIGIHTGEYNSIYNQAVWFGPPVMAFLGRHLSAFDRRWAVTNLSRQ